MKMKKMTLAEAFERILNASKNSKMSDTMLASVTYETAYIKRKFKINPVECVILAILLDNDSIMNRREMAQYLDCTIMKLLSYGKCFENLRRKRMIVSHYSSDYRCPRLGYRVCREVLDAVQEDASFKEFDSTDYTVIDVMRQIHEGLEFTDHCSSNYGNLIVDIRDLLSRTQHLELSRQLLELPLSAAERVMFLIAASELIFRRNNSISQVDYDDILEDSLETFDICNGINDGTGNLAKLNLLENTMSNGMAEPDSFQLTEHAIKTLLKEFNIRINARKPAAPDNLILPDKLTRKELFYNAEEQHQVDRLMDLLSPKTFSEVQQRLKESGMRTGFCVLLHGVPGSGKTELVNQLSIATGRPVLVAQVSQLISKWVGDYEKRIEELFDQYESLVSRSEICPILFFNECDAILGRRNEQGDGDAVSKMYHSVQNILLERMEKLNGIMICTSNMPGSLDKAFERRFLFSIEFHKPQRDTKAKIWRAMMPEIDESMAQTLAAQYDFSGGQIENVVRRQRVDHILYGHDVTLDSINQICREEGYGKKERSIGFGS